MKRSEIYLRAAENCHQPWHKNRPLNNVYHMIFTVTLSDVDPIHFPEINTDASRGLKSVPCFASKNIDRDFILLFTHEFTKDLGK